MGEKRDMFHFVVRKRHNASRDICTADYTGAEMILDRLETLEPLTPSEEALVIFIEEHASEVARLPIAEIAQRTSTSNATIVRFCRRLGLDGFRAFRLQLVAELERGATAMRTMDPDYPVSPDQSTAASLDMIANLTKEAVDGARAAMDAHDIQAVRAPSTKPRSFCSMQLETRRSPQKRSRTFSSKSESVASSPRAEANS